MINNSCTSTKSLMQKRILTFLLIINQLIYTKFEYYIKKVILVQNIIFNKNKKWNNISIWQTLKKIKELNKAIKIL